MIDKSRQPKYSLVGKTLVITDLHIGLKKANQSRLSIIIKVFKNFLKTIVDENISNVICCGDIFHSRIALDLQALNVGIKLLSALSEKCKCYLILGNHDLYYKNTNGINSSNVFKHMNNIFIIDETTDVSINGQKALFVPWLGKFDGIEKSSYDLAFGHFDINSEYLIASYIEEHSKNEKSNINIQNILDNDILLNESSNNITDIQSEINKFKNLKNKTNSNDLVGNFIEYVKPYGTIYAGHIHNHKEFVSKSRQFIFIGSPYQQNFGEIDSNCGYYVLDENNNRKFIETKDVPKHLKIKISDILNQGIENYDFSIIKNNIIKKIYDVEIDFQTETSINQKILDNLPFEESLSEYSVALSVDNSIITNESLETIKKSKLEYIRNYIHNMDDKIFVNSNIEKNELFKVLESYFNLVMENH